MDSSIMHLYRERNTNVILRALEGLYWSRIDIVDILKIMSCTSFHVFKTDENM